MRHLSLSLRFARACRRVAVGLIAPAFPRLSHTEIESRIAQMTVARQCFVVGSVLSLVGVAGFTAAQFGVLGLLIFAALIMLIVG
ncbi:MAG: hypothetical protein AAF755_07840 [Pseudomonadota bacterium]